MNRKKWMKITAAGFAGASAVLVAAGLCCYHFVLRRGPDEVVGNNGRPEKSSGNDPLKRHQRRNRPWLLEHASERWMQSYDDLSLHAYRIDPEQESSRYAVICHGYKSQASHMGGEAREFLKRGFHVLIPDARGHGKSEGAYIGMGWKERWDIADWAYDIAREDPEARIILYGLSMGAATVMMAAGEALPDQVKGVIEDCGYTSVWEEFSGQLNSRFHLPPFPVMHVTSLASRLFAGYSFRDADAVKQMKKCRIPMLFIHGDTDFFVPSAMQEVLFQAARCRKEKLVIPGAGHALSDILEPDLYWRGIDTFLSKYL